MEFDRGKFKELILYFVQRSEELADAGFGMVKLNTLLYRADFEAFRLLGHPITGETYERQDYGPVARDLPIVLDELGADGRLTWQQIPVASHARTMPTTSQDSEAGPDSKAFSADELKILERTLDELGPSGTRKISNWSHERSVGWNVARENGKAIEYNTALISIEQIPPEDLQQAGRFVRDRGWVNTS